MRANVDASQLVVRQGEASWPFRLDLDKGSASIEVDGSEYEVCPLSWRAKLRLARFAHMDHEFIQTRFLEACLRTSKLRPAEASHEAVLLALANWINAPSGESRELPLDQRELASVTVDVCRALRVGPMAFAELAAAEVEMLWRTLDRQALAEEAFDGAAGPSQPVRSDAPESTFDTRILIVPDQAQPESTPGTSLDAAGVTEEKSETTPPAPVADVPPPLADAAASEVTLPERKVVRTERNRKDRFRVAIDKPSKEPAQHAAATFRLPLAQPRRTVRPRAVGPTNFTSAAAVPGDVEIAEPPSIFETVPEFQIPAVLTATAEQTTTPVAAIAPGVSSWAQVETRDDAQPQSIDSMLEEFCERLAEAAADVGILEEV